LDLLIACWSVCMSSCKLNCIINTITCLQEDFRTPSSAYCRYVSGWPKVSNVSTQRFILLTYVCNCVKWRSQLLGSKWLLKRWCLSDFGAITYAYEEIESVRCFFHGFFLDFTCFEVALKGAIIESDMGWHCYGFVQRDVTLKCLNH